MFAKYQYWINKPLLKYSNILFIVVFGGILLITGCSQGDAKVLSANCDQTASGVTLCLELLDSNGDQIRNLDLNVTASVVATYTDADDKPLSGELIEFSTDLGTLANEIGLTDTDGKASVDLGSGNFKNAGSITATVTTNGFGLDVTYGFAVDGTVDPGTGGGGTGGTTPPVSQSSDGAMSFLSANPQQISLQSTGGAGSSELSTLSFKLVGIDGLPIANQTINFTINNSIGGIIIEPTSAISGYDGVVSTVVRAGTVPTSVRITATTTLVDNGTNNVVFAHSDKLAIGTGMPDQNSMSLSVDNFAPEGWNYDGVQVGVSIRLADQFNNPAPDGTSVYFTTEGGSIESSCEIANGVCTVNWVSQNPRPFDHRVTILATTLGSESFTDTDSNGIYNLADGEPFTDVNANGVFDEAFTDGNSNGIFDESFVVNGNSVYEIGDLFIDRNGNGVFDGDPTDPIGELVFVDSKNGNGLYDGAGNLPAGEFLTSKDLNNNGEFDGPGFADLGEPYLDKNENNFRDVDEYYVDTNGDGVFTTDGDGLYSGTLCDAASNICAPEKTVRIRKSITLVMASSFLHMVVMNTSTNEIYFSSVPGILSTSPLPSLDSRGVSTTFTVFYSDSAGQTPPGGTVLNISASEGKITGSGGTLPIVINDLPRAGTATGDDRYNNLSSFSFSITDKDLAKDEAGVINIILTTPKGIESSYIMNVLI